MVLQQLDTMLEVQSAIVQMEDYHFLTISGKLEHLGKKHEKAQEKNLWKIL